MLSKKNRLKGTANFEMIFKYGEKFFSPYFVAYKLSHDSKGFQNNNPVAININNEEDEAQKPNEFAPRIGFIASKKVGGAVDRNRARRMLSEAIRLNIKEKAPSADYIFIIKKELLSSSVEVLKEETKKLL